MKKTLLFIGGLLLSSHIYAQLRGLPQWPLTTNNTGQLDVVVDLKNAPTVSNIPNTGTNSVHGCSGVAIDDCGKLKFYLLYQGVNSGTQQATEKALKIFNQSGVYMQLWNPTETVALPDLNGAGEKEVQVIRHPNPALNNQWIVIYNEMYHLPTVACNGISLSAGYSNYNSQYAPSKIKSAIIEYNPITNKMRLLSDTYLDVGYEAFYSQGKAIAIDPVDNFLYLYVARLESSPIPFGGQVCPPIANANQRITLDKFVIDPFDGMLGYMESSPSIPTFQDAYPVNSSIEIGEPFGGNEYRIALNNRTMGGKDIFIFSYTNFTTATPRSIELESVFNPTGGGSMNAVVPGNDLSRKTGAIEWSADGNYLYCVTHSGDASSTVSNSYLIQLDMTTYTLYPYTYHGTIQQQMSNSTEFNLVDLEKVSIWNGSSYSYDVVFTKGNFSNRNNGGGFTPTYSGVMRTSGLLYRIPNALMPNKLNASSIDFGNNITIIPGADPAVNGFGDYYGILSLPDAIDGFVYGNTLTIPPAVASFNITSSSTCYFSNVTVDGTPSTNENFYQWTVYQCNSAGTQIGATNYIPFATPTTGTAGPLNLSSYFNFMPGKYYAIILTVGNCNGTHSVKKVIFSDASKLCIDACPVALPRMYQRENSELQATCYDKTISICSGACIYVTSSLTGLSNFQWQLNGVNIPGATGYSYTVTQAGVYTISAFSSAGCTLSSIKLTVNLYPPPTMITGTVSIGNPGNAFTVGQASNSTWSFHNWSNQAQLQSPYGPISQTKALTTSQSYVLTVTSINGCRKSVNYDVIINTLPWNGRIGNSSSQNLMPNELNVYPNPSNGIMKIVVTGELANQTIVDVVDILGKTIKSISLPPGVNVESELNLQDCPKGFYLIKIQDEYNNLNKRIVIE